MDCQAEEANIADESIPGWSEFDEIRSNRERILRVIKARWVALGILAIYGVFLQILYSADSQVTLTIEQQLLPLGAFGFVIAYNTWYSLTYRWWCKLQYTNVLQLLFDLLVITVLVHFSGGVHSWFWVMYLLVTFEATVLLRRPIEVWLIGMAGGLLHGALLTGEFYRIIPPVHMPFVDPKLQHTFTFEMISWGWVAIMNTSVALIGNYLMGIERKRETMLRRLVVRDALTNLYNRRYFFHRLNGEIERCKRYDRRLSILLLDVDNFKSFNDRYGHMEGDLLLKKMGEVLGSSIRRSEQSPSYDVDIPCRYGGEEFTIILPEAEQQAGIAIAERLREQVLSAAVTVAERIRHNVAEADVHGRSTTVSIGVASWPEHGADACAIVRAADAAMYRAKAEGKNCVRVAELPAEADAQAEIEAATPVEEASRSA